MTRAVLVESVRGFYLFDESARLVDYEEFPGEPTEAAERLIKLLEGSSPDELLSLVLRGAESGVGALVVSERVAEALGGELPVKIEVDNIAVSRIAVQLPEILTREGIVKSPKEYFEQKRLVSLELSRLKIKKAQARRDLSVVQAIRGIDELDKTINMLVSRLREWYGLYFPEMEHIVKDNELYAKIVNGLPYKEEMTVEGLRRIGVPERVASKLVKAAPESVGAELAEEDLAEMRRLAATILNLYATRRALEKYVDKTMSEVAPNIKGLVGPTIGARLIALAGGLQKLAMLPASTIQVLGAEKALFRALRYGTKPPKHGVIYQHPWVHGSPRWQRGKIARALAGKLAIAARIDLFTGRDESERLRRELQERVKMIKEMFPRPPPKLVRERRPVKAKKKKGKKRKRR